MRERYKCPQCCTEYLLDMSLDKVIKCSKCSFKGMLSDYTPIPVKDLYCKHCGTHIKIRLDKILKTITCVKCKKTELVSNYSKTPIKNYTKVGTDLEETFVKTHIVNGSQYCSNKLLRPAMLMLYKDTDNVWQKSGGTEFALRPGENTIGRMSSKSLSSIQLPTSDTYMSRSHLVIDVIMKTDSTFEHRLSDNGSTNGTFHNGQKIEKGDIVILSPGDIVRIGHTEIIFKTE